MIVQLAKTGEPPAVGIAQNLADAFALESSSRGISLRQLVALRKAAGVCVVKSLPLMVPEGVLALWAVVQAAIDTIALNSAGDAGGLLDRSASHDELADTPLISAGSVYGWCMERSRADLTARPPRIVDQKTLTFAFASLYARVEHDRWPLLMQRVSIAGDYLQMTSLFFSSVYTGLVTSWKMVGPRNPELFILLLLQGSFEIYSFDASPLVARAAIHGQAAMVSAKVILTIVFAFLVGSYLWVLLWARGVYQKMVSALRQHEVLKWEDFHSWKRSTVQLLTIAISLCMYAYQPFLRLCADIVVAQYSWVGDPDQATSAGELVAAQFGSQTTTAWVVVLAMFTGLAVMIPLPIVLFVGARSSRPGGLVKAPKMAYDLDGESVKLDERTYAQVVARDPVQRLSPYRSIYSGIKSGWFFYMVMQLYVKVLFIGLVGTRTSNDSASHCWYFLGYTSLVTLSRPFEDTLNNIINTGGKATTVITCFLGTKTYGTLSWDTISNLTLGVIIVHIVCVFVMVLSILSVFPVTRPIFKNALGWINFSDTSNGAVEFAGSIVPHWQLEKEVKHRVWQVTWRAIFLDLTINTAIQSPAKVEKKQSSGKDTLTAARRLVELEQQAMTTGMYSIPTHWLGASHSYQGQLRYVACMALEGVDVCWNARPDQNPTHSHFGRLIVRPDPFHCVVIYDENTASCSILHDDTDGAETNTEANFSTLKRLLLDNFSPEIIAKREMRQKIRVLSKRMTKIRLPFSRDEVVFLKDGIVTDGTASDSIAVTGPVNYTTGVLRVQSRFDPTGEAITEGFDVSMVYTDGVGEFTDPRTGHVHHLRNRQAVLGPDHIGLTWKMEESVQLRVIFEQTKTDWVPGLDELKLKYHQYRISEFAMKQPQEGSVLTDAFWRDVYNNARLSRDELEHHLRERESNLHLRSLPRTHRDTLDDLYHRLEFVYSHPAVALWYVFWDDVYTQNRDIWRIEALAQDFDPRYSTAICYRVLKGGDLEAWLRKRRLLGSLLFFTPSILDKLYGAMNKYLAVEKRVSGDIQAEAKVMPTKH